MKFPFRRASDEQPAQPPTHDNLSAPIPPEESLNLLTNDQIIEIQKKLITVSGVIADWIGPGIIDRKLTVDMSGLDSELPPLGFRLLGNASLREQILYTDHNVQFSAGGLLIGGQIANVEDLRVGPILESATTGKTGTTEFLMRFRTWRAGIDGPMTSQQFFAEAIPRVTLEGSGGMLEFGATNSDGTTRAKLDTGSLLTINGPAGPDERTIADYNRVFGNPNDRTTIAGMTNVVLYAADKDPISLNM